MSIHTSTKQAASSSAPAASASGPRRIRKPASELWLRNITVGTVMVSIVALLLIPIGIALVGSFHDWNPLNGTFDFTGIDNYVELFADATFWRASANTLVFGILAIVGRVVLGLAIAYALFSKLSRWRTFFRTIFYLPTVMPLVAVAFLWKLMYNPQFGAINTLFGLDINWLFDPRYSLLAIVIMTIWKDFGFAVILFLAGLYAIPEDVLEAASVDGANAWRTFWHIILPLLRPMLFFVVITSMIGYLQAFVQVLVMTNGGPGTSTQLISFMIYDQAFVKYDFGYASAIAFVLLVATAVLTAASWRMNQSAIDTPRRRRATKRSEKRPS
ncbi:MULTISPECIES: carbohydrate ABC transporter permease [unclassified Microbacterium]|uniref:carbohydrate ABC transporter permease n=1 Tax=unclassified Microbacterium TaxID=2609290 RepID=UPI000EA8D256|nr:MULTISPECIES: sugar ABC transporter permease [unclassified Microbacterium]RKN67590.1 sugar ABC transporter permease [Microbacterium sp. CGR2]